ncbi:hypothetical protein DPV78_012453 [Talaromyces pinophilus]|nr:hypothetical protein DPV78_012453 [Talaromyces pinophilus]
MFCSRPRNDQKVGLKTDALCHGQYENINSCTNFMDDRRPSRPTYRDDFEIAIICALPLEYDAVTNVFDGCWNDDGDPYGKVEGDQNTYTTGWIGQHNVVLVICSDIGKVNATSVATSCSMSFTQIKVAFLVGVCGVAPQTSDGSEILLGDVIVGDQVIAYDFGKRYPNEMKLKSNLSFKTTEKSQSVCRFVRTMQTDHYRELLPRRAKEYLRKAQDKYSTKYNPPQRSEDKLYSPEYHHKHQMTGMSRVCQECTGPSESVCELALTSVCEDLECDDNQLIPRRRLADSHIKHTPMVHWENMMDVHAIIEHLRQQKEDLLIRISDLKIQLRKEKELPPQVQVTDLVTVNDALGAIYSFSLSFVDSWEV